MFDRSPDTAALREVLAEVYAHGHGKEVRGGGAASVRTRATAGGHRFATVGERGPLAGAVVRVLATALGPRRWEPWNPYNDHRAHPSPRSAFLVDVWLVERGRRWRVDPVRRLLSGPAVEPGLDSGVRLELTRHPERLTAGYGPMADALAVLESGHVLAALAEAAAGLGLAADIEDDALLLGPVLAASPDHATLGDDVEADRVTDTESWWRRATAPRSSGPYPVGVAPDPRPLATQTLHTLAHAAMRPPPGSPAGDGRLRHRLALSRVAGHPDGWYAVDAAAHVERLVGGDALDRVQSAFSYERAQADVAAMHVAWVMTADLGASATTGGAAGYRAVLRTAGAVAQHVASAAAVAGLFCRPVRSVYEARLEAAAGAPAGHDFVYLLLIGRTRFGGFAYRLSGEEPR
ncbi:hypothetical protein BDK92_6422 [Micromonospora pisi]|uniref:Uncharacterized protein n=1 Tax=Micromonospora pisi TaxID=589240 RepID=A0A495JT23_9ACTN|nr:hypothetical protein [Micromonospora pisi]RKR91991.1 hypothetical protein BDK92_6422 [Micromonospora pisi]